MTLWPARLIAAVMFTFGLVALLKTDEVLRALGDDFMTIWGRRGGDAVRGPFRFFGWCALVIGVAAVAVFFFFTG
ncbi:hypothetical protein [Frigoribacterium sp. CFBP 13707]|uniref:hypothetical protein n=1 Tax=Frigoribacterium sp. CFBP 13707 TaxID=2775313 RepID=UPI0017814725|nr:hypothetical protein [Frigoribacterium sp. CFBP 13707]MBD8729389.1 hypothetical protein [Frigoribacterium sp. CFBP 13707]